jgi:hypothetical protein
LLFIYILLLGGFASTFADRRAAGRSIILVFDYSLLHSRLPFRFVLLFIYIYKYISSTDTPHCYLVLDSQSEAETANRSDAVSIPRADVALLFRWMKGRIVVPPKGSELRQGSPVRAWSVLVLAFSIFEKSSGPTRNWSHDDAAVWANN